MALEKGDCMIPGSKICIVLLEKNKQIAGSQSNCALHPTRLAVAHLLVFSNAIVSTSHLSPEMNSFHLCIAQIKLNLVLSTCFDIQSAKPTLDRC